MRWVGRSDFHLIGRAVAAGTAVLPPPTARPPQPALLGCSSAETDDNRFIAYLSITVLTRGDLVRPRNCLCGNGCALRAVETRFPGRVLGRSTGGKECTSWLPFYPPSPIYPHAFFLVIGELRWCRVGRRARNIGSVCCRVRGEGKNTQDSTTLGENTMGKDAEGIIAVPLRTACC